MQDARKRSRGAAALVRTVEDERLSQLAFRHLARVHPESPSDEKARGATSASLLGPGGRAEGSGIPEAVEAVGTERCPDPR